jgi:hypothetical protein
MGAAAAGGSGMGSAVVGGSGTLTSRATPHIRFTFRARPGVDAVRFRPLVTVGSNASVTDFFDTLVPEMVYLTAWGSTASRVHQRQRIPTPFQKYD